MDKEQIALDGPAASGKSTLAKRLADRLGAFFVNTGDMYRTLTWVALQKGLDPAKDVAEITKLLHFVDIRYVRTQAGTMELWMDDRPVDLAKVRVSEVTAQVSHVAKIGNVREWMVSRQRQAAPLGLLVMEGRDIGTAVFPHARYKFYVTASPEVRAQRRFAQTGEVAAGASFERVVAEITERDRIDMEREHSPLRPAHDAIHVDTSDLDIDQVLEILAQHIEAKRPK